MKRGTKDYHTPALEALTEICSDREQKATDRIAAAKLVLEHIRGDADRLCDEGGLRVVFENIEEGFCR